MNSTCTKRKETEFLETLGSMLIDIEKLRVLSIAGIVDTCGIRALSWRILLNYLPAKRSDWNNVLDVHRKQYKDFLQEIIIQPGLKRCEAVFDDHPLNLNPTSEWNNFFKDNIVLLQIDKDVRRLCPDIAFFQSATDYPCSEIVTSGGNLENLRKRVEKSALSSESLTKDRSGVANLINSRKKASHEYETLSDGKEAHWEVVERILFIYAKLNPGTGYVQGMNELVGPLYYTLASDPNKNWKEHAEADTFFCFTNLMAEVRDHFIKTLDHSSTGIEFSMNGVLSILQQSDPQLHIFLQQQKIHPQYYLFRWITLLLSQEFALPDVILAWDMLFSDQSRLRFLLFVCAAMISLLRDQLFGNDFSHNLKLLQNYPVDIDINTIFSQARKIRDRSKKHEIIS